MSSWHCGIVCLQKVVGSRENFVNELIEFNESLRKNSSNFLTNFFLPIFFDQFFWIPPHTHTPEVTPGKKFLKKKIRNPPPEVAPEVTPEKKILEKKKLDPPMQISGTPGGKILNNRDPPCEQTNWKHNLRHTSYAGGNNP